MTNFYRIRHDKAVTALKTSRHFIEQVTHNTPDLIFVLDLLEKEIVFINQRVEELFGMQEEEVYKAGTAIFDKFVHPEDLEKRLQHLNKLRSLPNEEILEVELRLKVKSGKYHWFRIRDVAFKRFQNGQVRQTIGIGLDIQDKKEAEEKAAYRQKVMQTVLDLSENGVSVLKAIRDPQNVILDFEYLVVNKAAEIYHGRKDLVGKKLTEVFPDFRKSELFAKHIQLMKTGIPYTINQLWSREGEVKLYKVSAAKLEDGFVLTWQEITGEEPAGGKFSIPV